MWFIKDFGQKIVTHTYTNIGVPKNRIKNIGRLLIDAVKNWKGHGNRSYIKLEKLPSWIGAILFDDLRHFDPVKVGHCFEWIRDNADESTPITLGPNLVEQSHRTYGRIRDVIQFYQRHYEESKPADVLRNRTSLVAVIHGLFSSEFQTRISWYMSLTEEAVREKYHPKH